MRRVIGLVLASVTGVILVYISRFWMFSLWSRDGLFGVNALSPNGGLLARWLRGTDWAPFELLIWVVLVFLVLTFIQYGFDKFSKS